MSTDTIAAIATAPGIGGVGIVRVSGPLVCTVARSVLGLVPKPRVATCCAFLSDQGRALDQGLALYFPGPASYTGEDVLELQGHGGPVVLDLVLSRCLALGARLARPGELTERAFQNGKLDLAQAEAVADLIESGTELAARMAMRSLQGAFSRQVDALIESLIGLRARLEATLDFPDDELDPAEGTVLASSIADLVGNTRALLDQARQGERIRSGLRVAVAGPPNAGKSSLFNALSRIDAAIVTPFPGTTRDPLRLDIQVDGLPVHLVDTAGIRETQDPIEREGVARAQAQMAQADLILWIYDATVGLVEGSLADLPPGSQVTLVRNKIDLLDPSSSHRPEDAHPPRISISALTGAGLDGLNRHLHERAGLTSMGEGAFVARRRHLDALARGLGSLQDAADCLGTGRPAELVALELKSAQDAFGEITGQVAPDDLLGRIFSSFCIGK